VDRHIAKQMKPHSIGQQIETVRVFAGVSF
jgi:hypothetical protein